MFNSYHHQQILNPYSTCHHHKHAPPVSWSILSPLFNSSADSWCGYKRNLAQKNDDYKYAYPLATAVVDKIQLVFQPLPNDRLLSACFDGYTQNVAESANAVIWKRCLKDLFANNTTFRTAVAMGVTTFNDGHRGMSSVMQKLGLKPGTNSANYFFWQAVEQSICRRRLQRACDN